MKKLIVLLVFLFTVLLSVNSQTAKPVPLDSEFMSVYKEALLLNENRFSDLDVIQIGDTVYFPARIGSGLEYWIADYPNYGVHDCIWNLTEKYLANQLPTVSETEETEVIPILISPSPEESKSGLFWSWFIPIFLGLLFIAACLWTYVLPQNQRRNLDYRPAISGGLSKNPAEAASQISALTGSRVLKSERGRLICARPTKVEMSFSDGLKKVKLISGEEYYRITQVNRDVRYARLACGNLIGGSFTLLPAGVTFVPSLEPGSSWKNTSTVKDESGSFQVETDDIVEKFPESEMVKFLRVAGEMTNKPLKINYKDLMVEFIQPKETEDK